MQTPTWLVYLPINNVLHGVEHCTVPTCHHATIDPTQTLGERRDCDIESVQSITRGDFREICSATKFSERRGWQDNGW